MGKTKKVGDVIRAICILDHPIPNTDNASSIMIIIPQKQLGRKSDIYVTMVSNAHAVCAKNLYIAIVAATVESKDPEAEIKPALDLLGPIKEMFVKVSPVEIPVHDAQKEGLFVTSSYDATSHFETSDVEVLKIYE